MLTFNLFVVYELHKNAVFLASERKFSARDGQGNHNDFRAAAAEAKLNKHRLPFADRPMLTESYGC